MSIITTITSTPDIPWLASERSLRCVSYTAEDDNAQIVTENGRKIIKSGTVYPANGATAVGIVFQDVDVTDGDAPMSLMISGHVWESRLNTGLSGLDDDAKAALAANGIFFDFNNVVPKYPEG